DIKGGKINFRVDKQANLHFIIGKASFDETKLAENYGAALDEVADDPLLARSNTVAVIRADLLRRAGRTGEAIHWYGVA
ncbi:hypothetical protein PXH80_34095, partial [Mycolicibacterium smegmatis]|nr:hypothetical protein [Mycolicibacterium smegmatis]